jgi:hypothetical protein
VPHHAGKPDGNEENLVTTGLWIMQAVNLFAAANVRVIVFDKVVGDRIRSVNVLGLASIADDAGRQLGRPRAPSSFGSGPYRRRHRSARWPGRRRRGSKFVVTGR